LLIYEARNTFGEIHSYVLPVTSAETSAAGVRQRQDKLFYVSPFVEMAMRYHFRIRPPGERVQLRILETSAVAYCWLQPSMAAAACSTPRSCCARCLRCRWSR